MLWLFSKGNEFGRGKMLLLRLGATSCSLIKFCIESKGMPAFRVSVSRQSLAQAIALTASVTTLPRLLTGSVVAICVLPFILNQFGIDFGSVSPDVSTESVEIWLGQSPNQVIEQLHNTISGSFTHTILEWSAFCAALFTATLAFSHFSIKRDATTPVIGVALLCAGLMDAFHTLAADHLIAAVSNPQNLIPFTWVICRMANVVLTITGIGILLILKPERWQRSLTFVVLTSLGFGAIAYSIIHFCATSAVLPTTQFPNSWITRPWDVAPLLLFALGGLFIYPRFYRQYPSIFSHALVISAIPNVATQIYMAFGSSTLFDNAFNIAHFLKIVAYLVPLMGLVLDYSLTHQQSKLITAGLEQEIYERQQAQLALERSETEARKKSQQLKQALVDLQQAQAQLIHSEKMSSLGQLVAGIAHEINNPINFIYGNIIHATDYADDLLHLTQAYQAEYPHPSSALQRRIDAVDFEFLAEDLPRLMASMRVGADRIRQIVVSLRNFSRLDEADLKAVDIHDGLDNTLMVLKSRLKAKRDRRSIRVITQYAELPLVECYPGQLNQVFMNLLSNAIDALRSCPQLEDPCIKIQTQLLPNHQVQISIRDNGPGIAEDLQTRIFDPFFTTKPVGQGTGLGLAIGYQIVVDKHGGSLICCSRPNEGAEFIVRIPLVVGVEGCGGGEGVRGVEGVEGL